MSSSDEDKPTMKSVVQVKSSWKDNPSESESENDEDDRDWRKRKNTSYIEKDSYVNSKYDNGRSDDVGSHDEHSEESDDNDKENHHNSRKRKHEERRRKSSPQGSSDSEKNQPQSKKAREPKKTIEDIFTKAGGAYIPPSKLRQMQESITDKTSSAFQRMSWEALKKSINGLVNKVNISNIGFIVEELLQENVIRGRGLLCQSIMRAQVASPTFTNVYAGLVSIINTKFPKIGELLVRRLIIQFRRSFKRNDKPVCINSVKFLAHLVNQQVIHELLALEVLTLLLKEPSSDSVEVAISFLKEVGQKLTELSPRGISAVFESLRKVLHSQDSDKRVQYMIEVMYAIRKDGFKDFPSVVEGLDLVEEDDQITHLLRLNDAVTSEDLLNVFKVDPNFEENEEKYKQIRNDLLESDDDDSDDSDGDGDSDDDDDEGGDAEKQQEEMEIIDKTETNLVALRRLIYLTIQSSLDYEECAHKMMKLNIKPGQEHEFCFMVLECCGQQRSYEKFFGLLGQRFCLLKKEFMEQYTLIFKEQYDNCHQLETNKLRNTAKFFGHLLHSDAIPWTVLEAINLNEDDTTSSSRIFIKILFQDLAEYLGLEKMKKRLADPIVAPYMEGVFPRDNPRNTRFSINFFTAVGLGGLTEDLRAHLKTMPKTPVVQQQLPDSSDSSSDSSSSSSSDSSSSSSSSSSSDEEEDNSRRRKIKKSSEQKKRRNNKEKKGSQRQRNRKENRSPEQREKKRSPEDRKRRELPEDRRRRESPEDRRWRESPEHRRPKESPQRRRESPEDRKQRGSPENRRRRESPQRRRESPEDRKQMGSPENRRRRESPESRRRKESPERRRESPEDRRRKESPERRRESPENRKQKELPQRRRESPEDRRRKESPQRRRESPENRRQKESPQRRRESPEDRRRKKSPQRRKESPENRRRKESPENRRRKESPQRRRESPEDGRRRESPGDRRRRESPDVRRQRDSPDDRRRRASPDDRKRRDSPEERPPRRASPEDRRRKESPGERRRSPEARRKRGDRSPDINERSHRR